MQHMMVNHEPHLLPCAHGLPAGQAPAAALHLALARLQADVRLAFCQLAPLLLLLLLLTGGGGSLLLLLRSGLLLLLLGGSM